MFNYVVINKEITELNEEYIAIDPLYPEIENIIEL